MNPDVFSEWIRRQGRAVIRTKSCCWLEAGHRVFQAFPYHWVISPDPDELSSIFRQGAVVVRYSTPIDAMRGLESYHVVFEKKEYELNALPKKVRHDITTGLAGGAIRPISLDILAVDGWKLRQDTLLRQGRQNAESRRWWELLCRCAEDLPGFEAWGLFVKEKLAAAILAFYSGDWFSILYQQSLAEYFPNRVNNALIYTVTQNVLRRPGCPHIFYGLHSLDAPSSVDEFKFRMGYSARPVRQCVVFNPAAQMFVNPVTHALIRFGAKVFPGVSALAKVEGLFRFNLQGNLPFVR